MDDDEYRAGLEAALRPFIGRTVTPELIREAQDAVCEVDKARARQVTLDEIRDRIILALAGRYIGLVPDLVGLVDDFVRLKANSPATASGDP